MKAEEFEECKKIAEYEKFMETALEFNNLSMDDYKEFMPVIFDIVPGREEEDPIIMYEAVIEELRKR